MTELVVKRGRSRRTHSEQFKQEVVDHCTRPGISLANVARQHGLHPSLLARWVKERTEPARMTVSSQSSLLPQFFPLRVESANCSELPASTMLSSKIEINIDRGELRIAFKVDPSQMIELGQVLREVLR